MYGFSLCIDLDAVHTSHVVSNKLVLGKTMKKATRQEVF